MKSLKMRVCSGAVVVMCATLCSTAFAATIAPAGTSFSAPGTFVLTTPNIANLSCGMTLSGVVSSDGSYAQVNSAVVTPHTSLCGIVQVSGLPWKVVATSTTTVSVANMGFNLVSPFSGCAPLAINGRWNNATGTLSAINQPLGGNCTLNSLSVTPGPTLTISP